MHVSRWTDFFLFSFCFFFPLLYFLLFLLLLFLFLKLRFLLFSFLTFLPCSLFKYLRLVTIFPLIWSFSQCSASDPSLLITSKLLTLFTPTHEQVRLLSPIYVWIVPLWKSSVLLIFWVLLHLMPISDLGKGTWPEITSIKYYFQRFWPRITSIKG